MRKDKGSKYLRFLAFAPLWMAIFVTTNATQASLGFDHGCALATTGTVSCWGDNTYSQLGIEKGTFSIVLAP